MSKCEAEIKRRRTFAIISHPDAGKTTLTEKFLLYGGAIAQAGQVKGKKNTRAATSDWMEIEKQRGISVTSSVMQFQYEGFCINILDTPGHQDFSEDTYRTLMAADSAVMVIDAAKGVEAQTRKLFKVCRLRDIPIFTFINKMDREARDPFELCQELEHELGIDTYAVNWPIGCGKEFQGVYDREKGSILFFSSEGHGRKAASTRIDLEDPAAAEQEEQAEERLPEVDPSLRLPNTVDFAALWEQNEDVYAWITVPGTLVDYPVLQHPSDDEYYLHHTIDHVEGLPGSIYSETVNAKDFTDMNTILYGHNMKNDTMFGSLHDYENANFFSEHPYVYIHLPERTLLYQIFSAVKFRSVYLPYYLNYEEEGDYTAYVEELKESPGYMNETAEPSFGNRLLTLHTCIGHDENHRYLVVAVLMGAYDKEL